MKWPWKLGIMLGLMLAAAGALYWQNRDEHSAEVTHYHAGFRVYIDDTLQDYSGYQYMNYTPCSEHEEKKSPEEEQLEKAHLHEGVGDVVHVHRKGAVWGDLFKNIKVSLPTEKRVVGYIDGVEVSEIMSKEIEPYTTAIFLVGESKGEHSSERVPREHIEAVEAKSELCGT